MQRSSDRAGASAAAAKEPLFLILLMLFKLYSEAASIAGAVAAIRHSSPDQAALHLFIREGIRRCQESFPESAGTAIARQARQVCAYGRDSSTVE